MLDFPHHASFQQILLLRQRTVLHCLRFWWGDFDNFPSDSVKAPPWKHDKVPTLRVPADHAIDHLSRVIDDLQLLIDLCIAAAVKDGLLYYFPHVTLLILDMNSGPVIETEAAIVATHAFVRRVLVVIEASDAPRSVRSWQDEALHQPYLLLQSQIHITFLFIKFVSRDELVFVGKIAGHERQSNWQRKRQSVVAVFKRI